MKTIVDYINEQLHGNSGDISKFKKILNTLGLTVKSEMHYVFETADKEENNFVGFVVDEQLDDKYYLFVSTPLHYLEHINVVKSIYNNTDSDKSDSCIFVGKIHKNLIKGKNVVSDSPAPYIFDATCYFEKSKKMFALFTDADMSKVVDNSRNPSKFSYKAEDISKADKKMQDFLNNIVSNL